MRADLDLEQRYRRVLRVLPRYYRAQWEEDMVGAFLDGWLTGDPDEDSVTMEYDRPTRDEVLSVVGLAARLYFGGVGAPGRYFAWGQAVRNAVLGVMLAHAVWGLGQLVIFARSRNLIGWLPPPAGGFWVQLEYATGYAWIVVFIALLLADYRTARALAALVVAADVVSLAHLQLNGFLTAPMAPFVNWSHLILFDLGPVLAMAAFHRDAPPPRRRPWLLALAGWFLLLSVPAMVTEASGTAPGCRMTPGSAACWSACYAWRTRCGSGPGGPGPAPASGRSAWCCSQRWPGCTGSPRSRSTRTTVTCSGSAWSSC